MLPNNKFQDNWTFRSGEEAKNRFSRWQPSWISDLNNLSYFWYTSHPLASYQVSSQLVFHRKTDFQDGGHSGHLGFQIQTILAIFDLLVTPMLPSKFQVNWLFHSGEEVKNRVSKWWPWWRSWISDPNDFSNFWSTSHPNASYQDSSQLVFRFRRGRKK